MSKFDAIYNKIQEGIGNTPDTISNNLKQNPQQNKNDLDLDALSNTLAKTTDPAAIKNALSPLLVGAPVPTPSPDSKLAGANINNPSTNQPSISMTGASKPTTSTSDPTGNVRTQSPTNIDNKKPQPTNTSIPQVQQGNNTKSIMSNQEIQNILNNVDVETLLKSIKNRTDYKHQG
jgi:hypothetical protein